MKQNFLDKILKNRFFGIGAIAVAIIAALILFLSDGSQSEVNAEKNEFNEFEYTQLLENKIDNMISKISGAGRTTSMITIENSYEKYYAKEFSQNEQNNENTGSQSSSSQSNDYNESYILMQNEDGESALEITEYTPKITGVVIVCEGGDNEQVKESIISAVSVLLGIPEQNVCVLKSK